MNPNPSTGLEPTTPPAQIVLPDHWTTPSPASGGGRRVRPWTDRISVLTPHNMRHEAPHRSAWRGTARSQQCPCGGMCGGRRTSSIQRAGSQSMTFLCPRATAFSTRISGRGVGRVGPWTDRLAHHHYAHLEHGRHVTTDSMHHINRLPVQTPRRL